MKAPFTKQEQEVMDLLTQAHNKFMKVQSTHPAETAEWVAAFHRLQTVLGERVLRRDYPETFSSL